MISSFTAEAVVTELSDRVSEVVKTAPGLSVKDRLRHAAKVLRLPFGRIQNFWYGEVRRVEAHEADQIRHFSELMKAERLARLRAEIETIENEMQKRAAELCAAHEQLASTAPMLARLAPHPMATDASCDSAGAVMKARRSA